MFHTQNEIASQPACWRRALDLLPTMAERLPRPGERIAVVGCGTSWYMAQSYAVLRETAGHGETDAFPASETPLARGYDRVVVFTRSGTTTEVLDLLARLDGRSRTLAITADAGSPVVRVADDSISLDFADERSVVQTRFPTTQLVLLRAHLGEDVGTVADAAEKALGKPLPADLLDVSQVTFLGTGWTYGLAQEAALKMREAAGAWTEAYPAMEYRHGPISVTGPGRAVWMLGEVPPGLADEVATTGGLFVRSTLDPLAELVRAQRLAVETATVRGLDPDNPRHLSRSVILAEGGPQPGRD